MILLVIVIVGVVADAEVRLASVLAWVLRWQVAAVVGALLDILFRLLFSRYPVAALALFIWILLNVVKVLKQVLVDFFLVPVHVLNGLDLFIDVLEVLGFSLVHHG